MKILKNFINYNRKLSNSFQKKHLSWYDSFNSVELITSNIENERQKICACSNQLKILEVGGIDRPVLKKGLAYSYDGIDVDHTMECNKIYDNFYQQSIEEKLPNKYDVIFSKLVLEHVKDNFRSWSNMYNSLNESGVCLHLLPAGLHPFSIINRFIGNFLQQKLIPYLRPDAKNTGYKAYYHCCTSISLKMIAEKNRFS